MSRLSPDVWDPLQASPGIQPACQHDLLDSLLVYITYVCRTRIDQNPLPFSNLQHGSQWVFQHQIWTLAAGNGAENGNVMPGQREELGTREDSEKGTRWNGDIVQTPAC